MNTQLENEVIQMQPGEELDRLIATEVLGLKEGVDFGTFPEHDWKKDEDGEIDYWALDHDHHNGPMCIRCYHGYCEHCYPNGDGEPCVVDIHNYSKNASLKTIEEILGAAGGTHHNSICYDGIMWIMYNEENEYWFHAVTLTELVCKYALIMVRRKQNK